MHYQRWRRGRPMEADVLLRGPNPVPIMERVARFIEVDENGCYLWTGGTLRAGYPRMIQGSAADGTRGYKNVHHIVWEHHNGPRPEGFDIHHTCGVRRCVNVEHLQLIGHGDHSILHDTAGRARAARAAFGNRPRPEGSNFCMWCGEDISQKRVDAHFCGDLCRSRYKADVRLNGPMFV